MGNLFIGFPVPRAKIADMISSAAPPLLHAADHEKDGNDEIDATDLVGAGGLTLPWDDLVYHAAFESLDGYRATDVGGGAITIDGEGLLLETGGTLNDEYSIRKAFDNSFVPLTWAKNKQFVVGARLSAGGSSNGYQFIGIGSYASGNCLGFRVVNGKFEAFARKASSEETHEIADWSAGAYDHQKRLKVLLNAAVDVEFWVDGVKEYTAITQIPTGTSNAQMLLHAIVKNTGTGHWLGLYFSHYHYWQAA